MAVNIYNVNQQRKCHLRKKYKKSKKWPAIVNIILLLAIFLYTLCCAICVNVFHIDTLGVCILISTFIALIIIWFIQKILVKIVIEECFTNRINEYLEYNGDSIVYRYQTRFGEHFDECIEITIPLRFIDNISYNSSIGKIEIYGIIHTVHYVKEEDICRNISNSHTFDTFTIFDYFEPSLSEILHFEI